MVRQKARIWLGKTAAQRASATEHSGNDVSAQSAGPSICQFDFSDDFFHNTGRDTASDAQYYPVKLAGWCSFRFGQLNSVLSWLQLLIFGVIIQSITGFSPAT